MTVQPVQSNKTLATFQKGGLPVQNCKASKVFLTQNSALRASRVNPALDTEGTL